jgi:putative ABC transport system substrate-binding protein
VPRVGILWILNRSAVAPLYDAFRQGLREQGYIEGRTIGLEARFAEGKPELLPSLAEELVRLKVDVLVAPSTPIARVLKNATATIPIVMANVSDPVGLGLVASLPHPGANVTGFSNSTVEQVAKNVELCKEAIPDLSQLAVLVNPSAPEASAVLKGAQVAAGPLNINVHALEARRPEDLDRVISPAVQQRAGALLVSTIEGFFFEYRARIIDLALRDRLPSVFAAPPFGLTKAGALLAYGASSPDMLRRAGSYVDKILKGDKPADLPVQQPTKFELGVNLRTARSLDISIPQSILVRADELVE